MSRLIIGIDPSLSSTGISDGERHWVLRTEPKNEFAPPVDIIRRVEVQCQTINSFIRESELWCATKGSVEIAFYIEDVLKSMRMNVVTDAAGRTSASIGVGHLFEMGFWFSEVYQQFGQLASIHLVTPSQLKGFVSAKGNTAKNKMPLTVYKRWGIEFDDDPGLDKLHAYCLVRLGQAVEAGDFEYVEPHRRGQGVRAVAKRKSRSRSSQAL